MHTKDRCMHAQERPEKNLSYHLWPTLQVTPVKEMKVQTGKQTAWQSTEVMPQYRANLKNTRMFLFEGEGSWSEVFQMPKRSLSNHQLTTRLIEQEHLQPHMTKNMTLQNLFSNKTNYTNTQPRKTNHRDQEECGF